MKNIAIALLVSVSPLVASAADTVSPADQATIYLNAAENNAFGLRAKVNGAQYYACRDVEVLKLIAKALSTDAVSKEAVKQNVWVLRNLGAVMEYVEKIGELCKDQLVEAEIAEAQKLADKISEIMSQE